MKKRKYVDASRRTNYKKRNLGYISLFDNPYPRCDVRSVDTEEHRKHCAEWKKKLFLVYSAQQNSENDYEPKVM